MAFLSWQSFKTGLKILVAGIPSAVVGIVGMTILGSMVDSLTGVALLWVAIILWIPVSLIITGWCATKLWRWR
jgi:hypothetical protein